MCGRISLFADVETIVERFDVDVPTQLPPRYNVAPSEPVATITNERPSELAQFEWGLVPAWADDPGDGPRPINARRERLTESSLYRDPYDTRRCLVVVDGYYEWQDTSHGRQPYRFERRDRTPFALAGLWDRWETGDRSLETVTILTAGAVSEVADVHDRMPVILSRDREADWLASPPADPASDALAPVWSEAFHRYPVSDRVNDPAHDDPAVIEPDGAMDQPTLTDF